MRRALLIALSTLLIAATVDDSRLRNAASEPANWLTYGGTYSEQRYSTLNQINTGTVSKLAPAWSFDFDTYRGQETTPIVVDGVMYVTSAWSKVYALDAKTGKQIWFYDPEVPGTAGPKPCCDVVNRGAAFYQGKVYVGTLDGRLIAIDARTGKLAWSTLTVDPKWMHSTCAVGVACSSLRAIWCSRAAAGAVCSASSPRFAPTRAWKCGATKHLT
ncbi:MAG: PQQ-binding-like beta-propeller repeat protein [Gammaproteobacteria bacterium]